MPFSSRDVKAVETELIINDADTGTGLHQFNFTEGWKTSTGIPDRFYNGDEHWLNFSSYKGTEIPSYSVQFKGTGIELYGEKQPGLGLYDVYIDNVKVGQADAYNATQVSKTKLYGVEDLAYGDHTLRVELTKTKNPASTGVDGEIDYVKVLGVNQDPNQEYVTKIEDSQVTNSNELFKFKYTGNWTGGTDNGSIFSNGDEHYASSGSVEMKFIGTKFEMYASKDPRHGIYTVTIDGEAAGEANANAASRINQQLIYTSPDLTDGEHTIKFEILNQADRSIQIDFAKITHKAIYANEITLSDSNIRLESGMTKQIAASVAPSIATNKTVVWESEDESIATVDKDGLITAVSETSAQTTITATILGTEIKADVVVNVVPAVEYLSATVGNTDILETQENYASLTDVYQGTWNDVAWKGDALLSKVVVCSRNKDVHNAEVTASDFVNGDATISSSNVDIKWLKNVKGNIGRGSSGAPVKDFPDVIGKGGKKDIAPEKVEFSWITFNIPEDAKPGTYTGTITVNADELEEPYVFDYSFEVLDLVQPSMEDANTEIQVWQHPFSVAEYYGVSKEDYFTEEHFQYLRSSMEEYKSIGGHDVVANIVEEAWNHQSYYGDPSMVKWTKNADGTMAFDYAWYDAWINFQIETGVLDPEKGIGQIKCYSIVPWDNQISYYDEATGTTKKQRFAPGSAEWTAMWTPFLQDFMKHSEEKGWFDITYISMDERGINELRPAVELIKSIKDENGKSFKISSAFNYDSSEGYDFSDKIDDISIGMSEITHETEKMRDLCDHRRELGLTTTVYTCTGMYPNNFMISDPADNEYVMWYTLAQNSDGFMRWAWDNYVPDMHGNTTYKYWEPGDGWFIYPGVKGSDDADQIYSTPRYEMMKKGIRDIDKAKYLMAQSDELNTEITELVRSIDRPTKTTVYGSATYKNQTERQIVFTETTRMRNGLMDYAREFIDGQVVAGDKSELQELYDLCLDAENIGYSDASWAAFEEAKANAKAVLDKEIVSQTEIDQAKDALTEAYENLKQDTEFAKGILKAVIDKAEGFAKTGKLDNLAPNVAAMIRFRIAEANMIYNNEDATNEECLKAWINLANALQYMDFVADKADLKLLIDECEAINTDEFISGVEAFEVALAEANDVYNNEDVLQATIDTAYSNLLKAKDRLVKENVNKQTLHNLVNAITEVIGDGSKYKHDEAWEAFQTALTNANNVLLQENATQEDVNNAFVALANAYADIRLIPNEALLAQLKEFVSVVDKADLSLYSEANVSKILKVRSSVANMLADPENIKEEAYIALQPEMAEVLSILQNEKVETPAEPETPSETVDAPTTNQGTVKPGTTKTGDATNMMGISVLLIASAGMLIGLKKRKH